MAVSDLFKDLDPKLANVLAEATEALRGEFDRKLGATRVELGLDAAAPPVEPAIETAPVEVPAAPVPEVLDPVEELKHAVAAVDRAGSQGEILSALVAGCSRFSSRCAVFLVREQQVSGWNSHGFAVSEEELRSVRFEVEAGSPWEQLAQEAGSLALSADVCGPICEKLGGPAPEMGLLVPFVLGNQTAAGIYCDRVTDDEPPNIAALQLLTFIASQVLENLPVRDRESTSTLRLADAGGLAAAAPPVGAEVAAEEAVAPAGAEVAAEEAAAPVAEPVAEEAETAAVEPEPEPMAPEEPIGDYAMPPAEPRAEPVEAEEPPVAEELLAAEPEPAPLADEFAAYEAEAPAVEPQDFEETYAAPETMEAAPEPAETAPETMEAAPEMEPLAEPDYEPEPAETAVSPEPPEYDDSAPEPPPPAIPPGGSTQVAPPSDLEGPGWAFSGPRAQAVDTGDEAQHEEARRLARLLVTEVKLYNEELVEQGRQQGNVYSVLKEDIDRSRQIFEDRIDEDVRSHSDYFHEALVRILAGGDPSLLGT